MNLLKIKNDLIIVMDKIDSVKLHLDSMVVSLFVGQMNYNIDHNTPELAQETFDTILKKLTE